MALTGGTLAIIAARLILDLTWPHQLGIDGGSYLVGLNQLRGIGETGTAFERLPLGPGWLMYPFVALWGTGAGFKVFAALSSILPLTPAVYIFARDYVPRRASVYIALAVGLGMWTEQLHVTGTGPTIGFGFLLLAMWGVRRLAVQTESRIAWRLGAGSLVAALPLIAFTSSTVAGIAAITLPIWAFYWGLSRRLVYAAGAGVALSLLALPWYVGTLASGRFSYPLDRGFVWLGPIDGQGFYLGLAGVALGTLFATQRGPLRIFGVLVLMHAVMLFGWSSHEAVMNIMFRSRHWLSFIATIGIGVMLVQRWPYIWRPGLLALILAVFVPMTALWAHVDQRQSSLFMSTSLEAAMMLADADRDGGTIIMGNLGEATWGQAITGAPVIHASELVPPPGLAEREPHIRCVLGWVHGCNVTESIETLKAAYVVVDTRWPGDKYELYAAPENEWQVTQQAPWLTLEYSQGSVRAWRVSSSSM